MALIEFLTLENQLSLFPHPYPANRNVPEWFKGMAMDAGPIGTLKRCPPFLEAMIAGYLIPSPCDIHFTLTADGKMSWKSPYKVIEHHAREQYVGAPFERNLVLKFKNPWVIRTPPGWACLILAPMNRSDMPFLPLAGIVETDSYYREVHIPMVSIMRPGTDFLVPRGAPLAQVVPIRHEPWTSSVGSLDKPQRDEVEKQYQANRHEYREAAWKKLKYE